MSEGKTSQWEVALTALLEMVPRPASPAHYRWTHLCMAATNGHAGTVTIRRSHLRALLRYANASASLSTVALDGTLALVNEQLLKLPPWLRAAPGGAQRLKVLSVQQVPGLLLQLSCATSKDTAPLFRTYASQEGLVNADWLKFVRLEQLGFGDARETEQFVLRRAEGYSKDQFEDDEASLARAHESFERAVKFGSGRLLASSCSPNLMAKEHYSLDLLQFSLELLNARNNALAPVGHVNRADDTIERIAHYWTSASHNSYCVGDQLTGRSSADAYRRQLLQQTRQLEIDSWDGPNTTPMVTHGGTFCTKETFDEVARAIDECAFVTSELPIVLSMEMHCSPTQQQVISAIVSKQIGFALLGYAELVATGRATSLSPADLKGRVLLKGRVHMKQSDSSRGSDSRSLSRTTRSLSRTTLQTTRWSRCRLNDFLRRHKQTAPEAPRHLTRGSLTRGSLTRGVSSTILIAAEDVATAAQQQIDQLRANTSKKPTAPAYAVCLGVRTVPFVGFMAQDSGQVVLPMTSLSENRLLGALGLPSAEKKQLEGLQARRTSFVSTIHGLRLTEDQLVSLAAIRLAHDPPQEVGAMQRRTAKWLSRVYPLGLRFSGKNMSPLASWLAGCHGACLNFSPIEDRVDLPVQLHFALFNNSSGYVLKPREMLITSGKSTGDHGGGHDDEYWPPSRKRLHRVSIRILSLHHLPKQGEKRPYYGGLGRSESDVATEARVGRRSRCHQYHKELSGALQPPNDKNPSSPSVSMSLHTIGGFSAVSNTLPLPLRVENEVTHQCTEGTGMHAVFGQTVHFVAAEPHSTILRAGVVDGKQEVAYETACLGALRCGYRVVWLRSPLGTRIELAYLFVHISMGSEANMWFTSRQIRLRSEERDSSISQSRPESKILRAASENDVQLHSEEGVSDQEMESATRISCYG